MKILFILLPLLFCSNHTFAQMASASLFSEMKSINPAVIGGRQRGQYTLVGNIDKYDKTQIISDVETATLDSKITGLSIFRGGNKGGLITTEMCGIFQSGNRNIKFRGNDPIDFTSDISFNFFQLGIGVSDFFGVQLTKQSFTLKQLFLMNFAGTLLTSHEKIARDSSGIKIGAGLPLGPLRLTTYYELQLAKQVVTSERPALPSSSTKPSNRFLGVAGGIATDRFHFELGLERFLNPERGLLEPTDSPAPAARDRLSGTIEMKLGTVALGYTGRLYKDGYQDQEQTVVNQLIYGNSTANRIEHIVNFSLGASQGLSFGGSLTYSKSKGEEQSPAAPASLNQKYVTTSKQVGLMAKVGYVW